MKNQGNAHSTGPRRIKKQGPTTSDIDQHSKVMKHTPNSPGEGNEDAERFGVVHGARIRLETFEYANHNCKNDDLAYGAHGKRDVRYPVASN